MFVAVKGVLLEMVKTARVNIFVLGSNISFVYSMSFISGV